MTSYQHSSSSTEYPDQICSDNRSMAPGAVRTIQRQAVKRMVSLSKSQSRHWYLVWCHERCHKPDAAKLRDMLLKVAAEGGGSIVLHKKSNKLLEWLARHGESRYVLLSDWREAKPCLEGLGCSEGVVKGQPLAFCVYCESMKTYERALEWAQGIPRGMVQVFGELSGASLKEFLAACCGIRFQDVPELATMDSMTPEVWLSQNQPYPQGSVPHLVDRQVHIETQTALHEDVVPESEQHLSVMELLHLHRNSWQNDVIIRL
eukprot:TRINITY_DN7365_c0_g2_i1.p1 TRINITY_DN7365_c0_g2~~TRINITY_DN7365_c0_g2_i1.p1  ORF type:complete len:282 (-),score=19.47 TRINITY_DN7365_c0_g2_i1:218-1000(-)